MTEAGGIVAFMIKMAKGETVQGITSAVLAQWWTHEPVRTELGDLLRAANKGSHEWIRCEMIMEVINRASGAGNYSMHKEGVKWVYLQHHLRSDTSWIIFTPDRGWAQQDVAISFKSWACCGAANRCILRPTSWRTAESRRETGWW